MFKISPINDPELQKKYAEECGATYTEGYFAYSMTDAESGELMGFSQFEIRSEGGLIKDLRAKIGSDDFEAMFILGRATMNFIDICGKSHCYADPKGADSRLLSAIGFKTKVDTLLYCDMTGLFEGHCSGHKVDLENHN